jgi:carbonic anhydrase
VQAAWKNGQDLSIHGWVYGLNSGFVTDLKVNISSNKDLDEVYQLIIRKIALGDFFNLYLNFH